MTIGIIGAGNIGGALAKTFGRPALRPSSRTAADLKALRSLSPRSEKQFRAGTVKEAAAQDIVIVAIQWSKSPDALADLELGKKVVIDANNPVEAPLYRPVDLGGRISSDVFADIVSGAGVVKRSTISPRPNCRAIRNRKGQACPRLFG